MAPERYRTKILEPHATNPGAIPKEETDKLKKKMPPLKTIEEVINETVVTSSDGKGNVTNKTLGQSRVKGK